MLRTKKAFTVIEVSLFVAISGFLIAGIVAGTSASIARQRYNDSVNSFTEFLRNVYSEAINVQNSRVNSADANAKCTIGPDANTANGRNPGRSNCATYGKLVTFGETDAETINVYDVIGNTIEEGDNKFLTTAQWTTNQFNQTADSVIASLVQVNADVLSHDTSGRISYASGHYVYNPEWQARIETTAPVSASGTGTKFVGALLIVRSPLSGTIHSYVTNSYFSPQSLGIGTGTGTGTASSSLYKRLQATDGTRFQNTATLNFCIASEDVFAAGGRRRNVRIAADGNTSTSVELVPVDQGGICN